MIAFDIDGVVVDFELHMVNKIKELTGIEIPYPLDKYYSTIPGLSKEESKKYFQEVLLTAPESKPIEGAFGILEKIHILLDRKILFITSRSKELEEATYKVFNEHIGNTFPFEIRFCSNKLKYELFDDDIKYFVDDDLYILNKMRDYIKFGFLVDTIKCGNDELPDNIVRVPNLKEVYKLLAWKVRRGHEY